METQYRLARTAKILEFLDNLHETLPDRILAVDTECTGLYYKDHVVAITISWAPGQALYIPVSHKNFDNIPSELLVQVLQSLKRFRLIFHNAKYDRLMLYSNFGILLPMFADTMIYAYVNAESRIGLKELSWVYLNKEQTEFEDVMKAHFGVKWKSLGKNWSDLDPTEAEVVGYACEDADNTLQIFYKLRPQVKQYNGIVKMEENLVDTMMRLTIQGVLINPEILNTALVKLEAELVVREAEIYEQAGHELKVNSPKDLAELFFTQLELPIIRRSQKTGMPSTDKETLEQLEGLHPIVHMIKTFREDSRMVNAYLKKIPESLDENQILHGSFANIGSISGRCTSQSVEDETQISRGLNLQNIPVGKSVDVRSAFICPEGWSFVKFDYAQVEYRVMASLSGDPFLIKAFKDGVDFHKATASALFNVPIENVPDELRQQAKTFNFGLAYGMTAKTLAQRTGRSEEEAQMFVERYFARTPKLVELIEKTKQQAIQTEQTQTFFGRLRKFQFAGLPAKVLDKALRQSFNTTIQGTAADVLKLAMIRVDHRVLRPYKNYVKMVLTVHDELDFYIQDEYLDEMLREIREAMEIPVPDNWAPFIVEGSVGKSWSKSDLKALDIPYKKEEFTGWKNVLPAEISSSFNTLLKVD